jgi:hypothetical protein
MDVDATLEAGRKILEPPLSAAGFSYAGGLSDTGSGGRFARGSYVKGNRRLDFSFRHSLGLVVYHLGELSISHEEFMHATAGGGARYPGFSDDPLQAFRDLRHDLEAYGEPFLTGTDESFVACVEYVRSHPRPQGLGRLDSRLRYDVDHRP